MSDIRERTLLGALLSDPSMIRQVKLTAEDFTAATHAQLFRAITRMVGEGSVVDAFTVGEALERETGNKGWMTIAANMVHELGVHSPSNAGAWAEVIRERSVTRQAAAIGQQLIEGRPIADAIRALLELGQVEKNHTCHILDAMRDAAAEMDQVESGKLAGVRTGIRDLDESLGGMHKQDLIVIAARPAMGKTAMMLNLAASADQPLGIISAEQGRSQIGMRFLAIDSEISLHRMRTARMGDEEWSRLTTAMNVAKGKQIWLNDKPAPTIDEIEQQARAWKFHNHIGLLMVDYLQKIRGGEGKDFRLQVGDITARLKNLGRELDIPVVALSQVKREVESRPVGQDGLGRMPYMGDLAESAIIEQEADQIMTLYRPEVYENEERFRGIAYVNICKNRHGPIGHKRIHWRGEHLKFSDLARVEHEYSAYQGAA